MYGLKRSHERVAHAETSGKNFIHILRSHYPVLQKRADCFQSDKCVRFWRETFNSSSTNERTARQQIYIQQKAGKQIQMEKSLVNKWNGSFRNENPSNRRNYL